MRKVFLANICHRRTPPPKERTRISSALYSQDDDLSLGFLKAYATKFEEINQNFDLQIYSFYTHNPPKGWTVLGNPYLDKGDIWHALIKFFDFHQPAVVCFTCFLWNIDTVMKTVSAIKALRPETLIVLGGPEASRQRFAASQADIAVKKEGEVTFSEILKAVLSGKDFSQVEGIFFKEKGVVKETADRPLLQNLDEIPSPYLSGLIKPRDIAYLTFSRGCRFKCAYCFEGGTVPRFFSLERAKKELEFCAKKGWTISFFNEADTNADLFLEILTELKRLQDMYGGHPKVQKVLPASPFITNEKFFELVEAVCPNAVFEVGLQSINDGVLKLINRPQAKQKIKEFTALAKKHGLKVMPDIIFGLPGESFFSFAAGINLCVQQGHDFCQFQLLLLEQTSLNIKSSELGFKFARFSPNLVLANDKSSFKQIDKARLFAGTVWKEFTLSSS